MGSSSPKYRFAADSVITALNGPDKAVLGFPFIKGKANIPPHRRIRQLRQRGDDGGAAGEKGPLRGLGL